MPKKIRELKALLRKAGFICQAGKGSHSKWIHPRRKAPVVISGKDGADANAIRKRKSKAPWTTCKRATDLAIQHADRMVRRRPGLHCDPARIWRSQDAWRDVRRGG